MAYRGKELLSDGVRPIFIEKLILLIRLRNGEGGSNIEAIYGGMSQKILRELRLNWETNGS